MKKNRLIKALKKANTEDVNKFNIFTIRDEKGQTYVISTEQDYQEKIKETANLTFSILLEQIDDLKTKNKLIDKFKKQINE
jgi:hypothetical protein|tara:strand:+ start:1952 stop:2194 length:243 start_codon:yes stop_codon:yes gene_type:complete